MSFSLSRFINDTTGPTLVGQAYRHSQSSDKYKDLLEQERNNSRIGTTLRPEPGTTPIYGPASPQPVFGNRGSSLPPITTTDPNATRGNPFAQRAASLGFTDFADQRNQAAALRG